MMQCLFCGNTEHTYSINEERGKYTIKCNMLEFFGFQIESYLLDDDVVCHVCACILETFSKLRRHLMPFIVDRIHRKTNETTPVKFGKVWDLFASTIDEEESGTLMGTRTPTPNLLRYSRSKPYETYLELEIARKEKLRSLSRASSNYFSEASGEVANVLSRTRKRKKRKGHNWSRRKTHKQFNSSYRSNSLYTSFRYSRNSRNSSPARSDDSDCSFETYYKRPVKRKNESRNSTLTYKENRLMNRRTRSVSRTQELEAQKIAERESNTYICPNVNCPEFFIDLEEFTFHKISEHDHLAFFLCDRGCKNRYTTREDLQMHIRQEHDNSFMNCLMCGEEFQGTEVLQKHIQSHMEYSVPCMYCDKYFLNVHQRDVHIKEFHKNRKVRVKQRVQGIVDRIDKYDSDNYDGDDGRSSNSCLENNRNNTESKQFTVRVLIQE